MSETSVLIACDDDLVGKHLRQALQKLGHACVHVARPLEVIRCLDGETRLRIAIVDLSFGTNAAGALLAYLAGAHPQIRRLLMIEAATARLPQIGLAAEGVLQRPWTDETLTVALRP